MCLKTVSVRCHAMECDQSPNEMTQTVYNFSKIDVIPTLACNLHLRSCACSTFDVLWLLCSVQELCQGLQLYFLILNYLTVLNMINVGSNFSFL